MASMDLLRSVRFTVAVYLSKVHFLETSAMHKILRMSIK